MTTSPRIVFMGSPDFAVPTLRALHENYPVVGVVTQPDRPSGRGRKLMPPPVKILADELGLPVVQPRRLREPEAMEQLRRFAPDLIVVAAYGQILRPDVLDLPPLGCINVHGSLLPRWRGAAPIQAAILAGDAETGITIMKMDAGVDTGPTLSQRAVPIAPDDTAGTLFEKMAPLGADLLIETLPGYLSGEIVPQPQDDERATYAPMLKKEDGRLDFSQPAADLARRVRAFNPWPGTFFEWNGALLKVHRASVGEGKSPGVGSRIVVAGRPAVGAGEGILILEVVQPAGKKPMPGKAFLSGARNWSITNGDE
ncbi:MAG: methionyl-tRNA formyltransferase [Chloroflexi bacterium]|nr:methionyl-tRNA formyltransferase [Chloroflexota bacterium]